MLPSRSLFSFAVLVVLAGLLVFAQPGGMVEAASTRDAPFLQHILLAEEREALHRGQDEVASNTSVEKDETEEQDGDGEAHDADPEAAMAAYRQSQQQQLLLQGEGSGASVSDPTFRFEQQQLAQQSQMRAEAAHRSRVRARLHAHLDEQLFGYGLPFVNAPAWMLPENPKQERPEDEINEFSQLNPLDPSARALENEADEQEEKMQHGEKPTNGITTMESTAVKDDPPKENGVIPNLPLQNQLVTVGVEQSQEEQT